MEYLTISLNAFFLQDFSHQGFSHKEDKDIVDSLQKMNITTTPPLYLCGMPFEKKYMRKTD